MDKKRKAALAVMTLGIAIGAGHFVQSSLGPQQMSAVSGAAPKAITPLAGRSTPPESAMVPAPTPAALGRDLPVSPAAPLQPATETALPVEPTAVEPAKLETVKTADTRIDPVPAEVQAPEATADCPVTLDAIPAADAMIDLTVLAPCAPLSRMVLRHGGLAITARTSASGALFLRLPAMDAEGEVTLRFDDGTEATAAAGADLRAIRRFAVQWQADDAFQLHAYLGDAGFGEAGHIHAGAMPGDARAQGSLMQLGDAGVALPLLAEVYTFPADPRATLRLNVEAEVTAATCDREILGEMVYSVAGRATVSDLSLAMPDCGAVGEFLVLNNPLGDTKLAAAD